MIKYYINLCLFVSICFSVSGQNSVSTPKLTNKESFSMVILPDPQSYTKFSTNQPIFELMTAWIQQNIDSLAIKAVLCTGDLVEQNEYILPDGKNGDQTSKQQWESASRAFKRLDNKVPYIISPGNHDYGYTRSENRLCQFPAYFPVERNNKWETCLVSTCNNAFGFPTLENSAYAFSDKNWGGILVITTEFAPRDEVLEWAKNLANNSKYNDYKVFILTHSYLTWDGKIIETENYKISSANYGKAIWEKLLFPASNIRMLICGHYCQIGDFQHNVGIRTGENTKGEKVFQMMFNAQTAGGGWNGNGGDGWLRYMEFMPDGKTIKIKTYSPFFGISPTTAKHAWRTNKWDEFEIVID